MISPSQQKVIQIEVTDACPHGCSNCTRFCGVRPGKPFFMAPSAFKDAVESLDGYTRMVGMMGGEPTLHPDFPELTLILAEGRPERKEATRERYGPIRDFAAYRAAHLADMSHPRGLWTSLGPGYARHHELIQDFYPYQCINDHRHDGRHMALLLARADLGIGDREWRTYRDNCWLQREWSGSVSPKGAFFCEVAAALDLLFGGDTGWPVEKGWWKRRPGDFGRQLEWCELCSACLPVPVRPASDGIMDVSPTVWDRLEAIGSPAVGNGRARLYDPADYDPTRHSVNLSCEPYLDPKGGNQARVSPTDRHLKPNRIGAVTVCVGYDDYLALTLPWNVEQVDRYAVVTTRSDTATQAVAEELGAEVVISDRLAPGPGAPFPKSAGVNDGLAALGDDGWILHLDADVILPPTWGAAVRELILNPGALYYTRRWGPGRAETIPEFMAAMERGDSWHDLYRHFANKRPARKTDRLGNDVECFAYGYFQLFHPSAMALRVRARARYPETSGTAEHDDMQFAYDIYTEERLACLPLPDFDVIHLPHGGFKQNWSGRVSPRVGADGSASPRPDVGGRGACV